MIVLARGLALVLVACLSLSSAFAQQAALPALDRPVNDFAGIIDASSRQNLDQMIRALQSASSDVVVVATTPSIEPYGDIRDYAVALFQNQGRGIGDRSKDNGLLILVAPNSRRVWIEVGYGLEEWIPDGFAGEVSREMTAEFRNGDYGTGLVGGTSRIIGRIAQGRNVQLTNVPAVRARRDSGPSWTALLIIILIVIWLSRGGRGPRRGVRRWGGDGWSGWSSGVGPFGGGGWHRGGGAGW